MIYVEYYRHGQGCSSLVLTLVDDDDSSFGIVQMSNCIDICVKGDVAT